jgi:hypothetical protein
MSVDAIQDDIVAEALRIVKTGDAHGITLRLLGGLAVRLHSPSATHRDLARSYPDLDFATPNNRNQSVENFITRLGYAPNKNFNLFNGDSRLLFYDEARSRQMDVFIAKFEMSHRLPITERIRVETLTLPLAELLLTKLQIVQMNEKDIRDICALLVDHPLGDTDVETINLPRMIQLTADDWGLWKTATLSMGKVREYVSTGALDDETKVIVLERLDALERALNDSPKPLKWKMRARIGEKVQWYELPEEVRRG